MQFVILIQSQVIMEDHEIQLGLKRLTQFIHNQEMNSKQIGGSTTKKDIQGYKFVCDHSQKLEWFQPGEINDCRDNK